MKPPGINLLGCLAVALHLTIAVTGQLNPERVRMIDVQTILLRRGSFTNGRRTSPTPQMRCTGGSAGCKFDPPSMQCYNRGWDGRSVQWECKADLDDRVQFGNVHVSCEGFSFPGDEFILAGSCGAEYTLELTEKGKKSGDGKLYPTLHPPPPRRHPSSGFNLAALIGSLITFFVIGIFLFAVYSICTRKRVGDDFRGPGAYFPGGVTNINPSYPSAPPAAGFNVGSAQPAYYGGQQRSWNPFGGFLGGAASGGMLGYLLGSRNRGYEETGGSTHYDGYRREYSVPIDIDAGTTRTASGFADSSVR